jgi:hypothetical protein
MKGKKQMNDGGWLCKDENDRLIGKKSDTKGEKKN